MKLGSNPSPVDKVNTSMKTIFITRTKSKRDFDNKLEDLLKEVKDSGIQDRDIYVISNFEESNYEINPELHVRVIENDNPISPISFNTVFNRIEPSDKVGAFLVCSKEVDLKKEDIKTLTDEIHNNPNLLAAGYKFKHDSEELNNKLAGYYANKNLIAYRVPWNTYVIWNYKLFNEYVKKFDEITLGKYPFGNITVTVNGAGKITRHKGMEDGLAIAQAVSQSGDVRFKLLEKSLAWAVKGDKKSMEDHLMKLARKDLVMRNFMAIRNYSIEDLEAAEIK